MLTGLTSFISFMFLTFGIVLAFVGIYTVAHLFVQDMVERHERRFHRDNDQARTPGTGGK